MERKHRDMLRSSLKHLLLCVVIFHGPQSNFFAAEEQCPSSHHTGTKSPGNMVMTMQQKTLLYCFEW